MFKAVILIFLLFFNFTEAVIIAAVGDAASIDYQLRNSNNGPDTSIDTSNSENTISLGDLLASLRGGTSSSSSSNYNYAYPSSSYYNYNNYGYQQPQRQPIYGSAGYTTGQINNYGNFQAQTNLNYNEYQYHYWRCVNYYRGQYYYSYTYNGYVCDTRANRYG